MKFKTKIKFKIGINVKMKVKTKVKKVKQKVKRRIKVIIKMKLKVNHHRNNRLKRTKYLMSMRTIKRVTVMKIIIIQTFQMKNNN